MATIEKRGKSYRISVSDGYDLKGHQIRHTMTWTPPDNMTERQIEKEVNRQAVLYEDKCRLGQVLDGSIRFADFTEIWLRDYGETNLRSSTLHDYRRIIKNLNQEIGHIRLDQIRPAKLVSLFRVLEESEKCEKAISYHIIKDISLKKLIYEQNMTLEQFCQKANISIRTLRDACAGHNVSDKTAHFISDALSYPLKSLFVVPKELPKRSSNTIRKYRGVLSSILSTAVMWQLIPSNPCKQAQAPKAKKTKILYLDENEAIHLLDLVSSDTLQHQVIVALSLFTGMRRAEMCGLEWDDIDEKKNLINIGRSSLYLPEKGIFTDETKNETSSRSVKVPESLISLLHQYRRFQQEQRLKLGDRWQESNRILIGKFGAPIHPSTVTNWFRKFIEKSNLPRIHLHSMRHTNVTLQIAGGIPLTTIAARVGHADVSTTTRIYAHEIRSANEAASDYLEDLLHPQSKRNSYHRTV